MKILSFVLLFLTTGLAAQHSLSGHVNNERGESLDAAIIFLAGTAYTTITDPNGFFLIDSLPSANYNIEITYLGYEKLTKKIDLNTDRHIDFTIDGKLYNLDQIEVISNRVDADYPFTFENISRKELDLKNLGQDVPLLLNSTPSTVVTSDAGNGVGYTGLRIRGTDPSRINVTINGIPINDAESQGVFWVNMPDLTSSVSDIQVQRGVGPSTNGAGAYGGTISVNTQDVRINPYVDFSGTLGSFGTHKYGVSLGTGLMNNKYSIDIRYSAIGSNGYIDRATSDLSSYYISIAKVSDLGSFRFITFSGNERTYQSWYGTPEAKVKGDQQGLQTHYNNNKGNLYVTSQDSINLFNSDRRYNYYQYEKQVDDYSQTHYQMHVSKVYSPKVNLKGALFYTRGLGFFEEFKYDQVLNDYEIPDYIDMDSTLIASSDLVRRRWLDNDLFGGLFNLDITPNSKMNLSFGGAISRYIGDHFGEVHELFIPQPFDSANNYYDNIGKKTDGNVFGKLIYTPTKAFNTYLDLQLRGIDYQVAGDDNDGVNLAIDTSYQFFNPKAGVSYQSNIGLIYASAAVANREPDRSDFLDNPRFDTPEPEQLIDYELGLRRGVKNYNVGMNIYYMDYNNQLIQTGDLNDVGSVLRSNVKDSYRLGLELDMNYRISDLLRWNWDLNLSKNKIDKFTDVLFDYTSNPAGERIETEYDNTDISFSPNIIARNEFVVSPIKNLAISLESKYIGAQFLDNTQSDNKKLDAYLVNNLRFNYTLETKFTKGIDITLMVNNILDTKYSANGYTYSYGLNGLITENYLYPQAGINFLLGLKVRL